MKEMIAYREARDLLLELAHALESEKLPLDQCGGRILACSLVAAENVPSFDRSPYDGYAFRSADTQRASKEHPVVLKILEEVPAGSVPSKSVVPGTAVKILTGAPIPEGADAVEMYEKTYFTEQEVSLSESYAPGDNIIYAGEDVKKEELLAAAGTPIDAGLAGSLAAQGVWFPYVYKKPLVGIISTGSELVDCDPDMTESDCRTDTGSLPEGMIRNTNRYSLTAALQKDGCDTVYLGTAADSVDEIQSLIRKGLEERKCDLLVLTGGVSAGDYDLTPDAMQQAGCTLLVKGVQIKPGMACCYGMKGNRLVCALSGNPSSSLINYYAVVRPVVRKMAGYAQFLPEEIIVSLENGFFKKSKGTRLLKGRLTILDGKALMHIPKGQGNVMIGSFAGCDMLAEAPAGSDVLEVGTELKGFLL